MTLTVLAQYDMKIAPNPFGDAILAALSAVTLRARNPPFAKYSLSTPFPLWYLLQCNDVYPHQANDLSVVDLDHVDYHYDYVDYY